MVSLILYIKMMLIELNIQKKEAFYVLKNQAYHQAGVHNSINKQL